MNFPTPSAATSFVTIEDMMRARDENRGTNKSNNSTYIRKMKMANMRLIVKPMAQANMNPVLYVMQCPR